MIESPKPDDPSIRNEDELLRRVPPKQIEPDGSPSTAAFQDPHLSVFVARLTTPEKTMEEVSHFDDFQNWRIAGFLTRVPRAAGLIVYMDATPTNPAHAIVWGRKKLNIQRKLAKACRIVPWTREGSGIFSSCS